MHWQLSQPAAENCHMPDNRAAIQCINVEGHMLSLLVALAYLLPVSRPIGPISSSEVPLLRSGSTGGRLLDNSEINLNMPGANILP